MDLQHTVGLNNFISDLLIYFNIGTMQWNYLVIKWMLVGLYLYYFLVLKLEVPDYFGS